MKLTPALESFPRVRPSARRAQEGAPASPGPREAAACFAPLRWPRARELLARMQQGLLVGGQELVESHWVQLSEQALLQKQARALRGGVLVLLFVLHSLKPRKCNNPCKKGPARLRRVTGVVRFSLTHHLFTVLFLCSFFPCILCFHQF